MLEDGFELELGSEMFAMAEKCDVIARQLSDDLEELDKEIRRGTPRPGSSQMTAKKTVRELGGEIWAELGVEQEKVGSPLAGLDYEVANNLVDFIMSILARHTNTTIVNDVGLEVEPRPRTSGSGDDLGNFGPRG